MINDYLITLDVDWASDPVIAEVSKYLIENNVKATWFITHDSPEVRKLSNFPHLFELGLHPNFCDNSTQGKTPKDVMRYLAGIFPKAKSVRTHCLLQSYYLLRMMRVDYDIQYDSSLLLFGVPNIIPHELFFSGKLSMLRFPIFWEDDYEMYRPRQKFSLSDKRYHLNGIKIFNFHPIHIALNSNTMDNYALCKLKHNISKCTLSELKEYTNSSQGGTGTFFKEVILFMKKKMRTTLTLSELADKWMLQTK